MYVFISGIIYIYIYIYIGHILYIYIYIYIGHSMSGMCVCLRYARGVGLRKFTTCTTPTCWDAGNMLHQLLLLLLLSSSSSSSSSSSLALPAYPLFISEYSLQHTQSLELSVRSQIQCRCTLKISHASKMTLSCILFLCEVQGPSFEKAKTSMKAH